MRIRLLVVPTVVTLLLTAGVDAGEYAGRGGWGAKDSVFRVRCRVVTTTGPQEVDLGTAFGHKSGKVLSASHVVTPCLDASGRLQLVASDARVSPAAILARDSVLDLVLLEANVDFVKNALPIASKDTMTMGAQVSTWGFPSGYSGDVALLTVGHLAGVVVDPSHPLIRRWVVNAAINKGNSGGPLVETETPAVIGVVIQKLSPLTPEVDSQLKDLAKTGGPEAKVLARAMADIAERAQLVIGHSVLTADLWSFLRNAGVDP